MVQAEAKARLQRIFTQSPLTNLQHGSAIELPADESKHAMLVLRLAPGTAVEICDGQGRLAAGILTHGRRNSASVTLTAPPLQARW